MIYIITRHGGAQQWINQQIEAGSYAQFSGQASQHLTHLASDVVLQHGDIVIGNLPVGMIATFNKNGVRYFHLDITIPAELRGKELELEQLIQLGATLQEYCVISQ